MGDHGLHRLAVGDERARLHQLVIAKHVDDPIDLAKGAASFAAAPAARFPIIGQITEPVREFHPPTTSVVVQAIYDADSIALLVRWHDRTAEKTGTNGPSLSGASGRGRGGRRRRRQVRRRAGRSEPLRRRRKWRQRRQPEPEGRGESLRGGSGAGGQCVRVLGRRLDPDSLADADGRPQAILHLRRRSELGGSLVLRSCAPQLRSNSPAREAATSRPTTRAMSRASRATTRESGRSSSSGRFAPRSGAPFTPGRIPAHRVLGLGRVLARAWQPARALACGTPLYVEPEDVPSAVGPMIRTALFILVIELAVIGCGAVAQADAATAVGDRQ